MDEISKRVVTDSLNKRLALAGHTEPAQQAAWLQALIAIVTQQETEAAEQYPAKERANFRQMLGMARQAFAIEIEAYRKYLADVRKGIAPAEAAARMTTRLEHKLEPVKFV